MWVCGHRKLLGVWAEGGVASAKYLCGAAFDPLQVEALWGGVLVALDRARWAVACVVGEAFDAPDLETFDRDWAEACETPQTRAWGRAAWMLGARQRGVLLDSKHRGVEGLVLRDADALYARAVRKIIWTAAAGLFVIAGLVLGVGAVWGICCLGALVWVMRRGLGRALHLRARLRAWESSEQFSVSGARQPLSFAVPIVSSETSRRGTIDHPSPKGSPQDEIRSLT